MITVECRSVKIKTFRASRRMVELETDVKCTSLRHRVLSVGWFRFLQHAETENGMRQNLNLIGLSIFQRSVPQDARTLRYNKISTDDNENRVQGSFRITRDLSKAYVTRRLYTKALRYTFSLRPLVGMLHSTDPYFQRRAVFRTKGMPIFSKFPSFRSDTAEYTAHSNSCWTDS